MALTFSPVAAFASSIFKRYRNDITIFTEDQESDNLFYKEFYKRLLKDTGIQINDITQLGSCSNVLETYENDTDTTYPKIYIVDGDIDLLCTPKKCHDRFFALNKYCIENYLIDAEPFLQTLSTFMGTKTYEELKEMYNYDENMSLLSEKILPLFLYMSILRDNNHSFTLYNINRFYKKGNFDDMQIQHVIDDMKSALKIDCNLTDEQIHNKFLEKQSKFPVSIENVKKYICGKDYIFPYLKIVAKNKFKCNSTNYPPEAWKRNCAQYADLSELDDLKQIIIKLCS